MLLFAFVGATWAQTATIETSTNASNPEKVYVLSMLNGYWMTSNASPTQSKPAKFAFFADGENKYKVYCVDTKKWLSYDKADSYSNGTGKGKFVDNQADANSWVFVAATNGSVSCYSVSPIKNDGTTAAIYWNWIYGVGQSNPLDGTVTIGYYTTAAGGDKGSAWVLTEVVVPTAGTEYMLADKCGTHLDLYNYGKETNDQSKNQLATMNAEPQPLYITTVDGDNWSWKIHTEAEGGKYLHQSSTRSWNSWVSEDGGEFVWKVELAIADKEIFYVLKNENKEPGYLGGDSHSAGKELYVNNGDAKKLKLKFAEAKVVYNFKLNGEVVLTETFYTKKGVEYPNYTVTIPEGVEAAAKPEGNVTQLYEVKEIAMNYSGLPFELTTITDGVFAEGTKWYYLTMRSKGVTYDPATGKALANNPATKDAKNMFAFVGNPIDGYSIYNYVAGADKVFWRGNDDNGGRVFFTKVSETDGRTWELHENGNKGFVFKMKGTANGWLNDHKNDLAIWNYGLGATDDGSTITFAEVPADELLANVKAYFPTVKEKATSINEATGEWIGYYSESATFDAAYASAQTITEESSLQDIVSATCKLQTAVEGSLLNLPDPNKFYRIKSASTNAYCADKYVHPLLASEVRTSYWGDRTLDHRHLVYTGIEDVDPTTLTLWQFTEDMKMKNVHTNEYVKTFNNNSEHMGDLAAAATITFGALGEGQSYLKIAGNNPMHAQDDYDVIVTWTAEKNNASAWTFEEVDAFSYTATITEAGYSTLVLGFNAVIPNDVEAYAVTAAGDGVAEMTQVTGVLPANQAVILKGAEGDYEFAYTEETAVVEGNLLKGTLFNTNVAAWAYVLGNNGGVGLFKATLNQAEGTAFLNNANKAYLLASDVVNTPQGALRFNFGGTTAIESVVTGLDTNAAIYDLSGRRVEKAVKGIYIQNGKKIIVK